MNLNALFRELNHKYFGDRLPKCRVVRSSISRRTGDGECADEHRLIRVRRGLDDEHTRRVLLHEMCHIGLPYHGRRWQERMMKLARQGEPWAEEEARQYQDGNIMKAKHVWHSIQDFLDEEAARFPQRRISTLRRICAQHWGFSPAEFRKRFPRFDAYYKREKELQRRIAHERAG